MYEDIHINLSTIINKIIVSNSNYEYILHRKLLLLTDFDLVPIYYYNKLEKKIYRYVKENISTTSSQKNAFYLAKHNHSIMTYDHEILNKYNIKSVARPIIISDRIVGFLGFFSNNTINQNDIFSLDLTARYIVNEFMYSNKLIKLKSIVNDSNVNVFNENLSERECQVLECIINGYTDYEIQKTLHISKSTVRAHLHNTFEKIGVNSKYELINHFYKQKLDLLLKTLN